MAMFQAAFGRASLFIYTHKAETGNGVATVQHENAENKIHAAASRRTLRPFHDLHLQL
jgi:hypothetical protein